MRFVCLVDVGSLRYRLSLRRGDPADLRKTPKSGDGPAGRAASHRGEVPSAMDSAGARRYARVASMQVGRRRDFKDKARKKVSKVKKYFKSIKM